MPKKGEKMSESQKKKISRSMMGKLNALVDGGQSVQVRAFSSPECSAKCALWDTCPQRIEQGGSICPLRGKLYALSSRVVEETGNEFYYNFENLVGFLGEIAAVQALRYEQSVSAEIDSGLSGDPEVTRLGKEVFQEALAIGRALGLIVDSPSTVILDQRRQTLQIAMERDRDALTEKEYEEILLMSARFRDPKTGLTRADADPDEVREAERRLAELMPGVARLQGKV